MEKKEQRVSTYDTTIVVRVYDLRQLLLAVGPSGCGWYYMWIGLLLLEVITVH